MALTLITGRAITGKTGVLHRAVIDAVRDERPAVLLVPAFADVRRSRAELAHRAPLGLQIDTLDRWAESLWASHGTGERLVTDSVRRALVSRALAESRDNPLASSTGYRELVASLAARTAGLPLAQVRGNTERRLGTELERYGAILSEHALIEWGHALVLLAEMDVVSGFTIAVNRFTDLSPQQTRFVMGLAGNNDVYLALNWAADCAATEASDALVRELVASDAVLKSLGSPDPESELQFVERRLFDPAEPIELTGAVRFMTAAGDEAECALAARTAARLIADGTAPHEIAITFREVSRRKHLLEAALSAEGIGYVIDMTVPVERTPLGRSVSALLGVAGGGAGREELMAFLLSPYSGADPTAVGALDAWARRNRVDQAASLLDKACDLSKGTKAAVAEARVAAHARLDSAGAEAWARLADVLVENGLSRGDRPEAELMLDGSVHSIIVRAADDLAALPANDIAGTSLLTLVAGVPAHSGGEEREGAVYVTEAHRLRSRRFSAVVVGGLTAKEFSSEKREPLSVQVLQRLGLPAGTEERLSERLLFYSVVTRARDHLVMLRQASTATGDELRPSVFWEEVADLYRTAEAAKVGAGEVSLDDSLPLSELEQAAPAFVPGRRELRARIAAGGISSAEAVRGSISEKPWTDEAREFSVTELETYHSCPYRWFYDRMLRPRELDTSFEAKERGALVHSVLAEFYRRAPGSIGPRVRATTLPAAMALLEEAWSAVTPRFERTMRGLAEQLALGKAREWADEAITQDALLLEGFMPIEAEWGFGIASDRPSQFGSVRMKGSVDRLDSDGESLVVTDYKSSSDVQGCTRWEHHGLLQVLVYAEVASEQLALPVAGGIYRSLATGELRGFWNTSVADPEDWVHKDDRINAEGYSELVARATTALEAAVNGIRNGDIAPQPRSKNACTWCGAKPFCEAAVS